MSYLKCGDDPFDWAASQVKQSVSRAPGCVQCGRTLEMNAHGTFHLSGRCFNCVNPVFEDDELIEDLDI